jgi:hypothetical protein
MLVPSCTAVGLELVILCPAQDTAAQSQGPLSPAGRQRSVGTGDLDGLLPFRFADKRLHLSSYLSRLADRDELVVFTDAYDTLFVRGEAHIQAAYAAQSRRVVFSAEMNCWPLGLVGFTLYDAPPAGPYRYLNSGGFIGTAGDILDLFARYPDPPSARFPVLERLRAHGYDVDRRFGWSDQYYWTLVHLLEKDAVGLDHEASLFQCYAPHYPDIDQAVNEGRELRELGTASPAYQRERARLPERLRTPGTSAQVHFCSGTTKAVAMELFEQGQLPDWLGGVLAATPEAAGGRVSLVQV